MKLREDAARTAADARRELAIVAPITIALVVVSEKRRDWLPGFEREVQFAAVLGLMFLGWILARDLARVFGPRLLGRLGPEQAATIGFALRLLAIAVITIVALRLAGLPPETLAFGGAAVGVIVGLAAQQTLGNLFAGMVLVTSRPFRVGERVRFQVGALAGQLEGTVVSLGLMYIELSDGPNRVMVPNSAALAAAVTPLKDVDAVDFEAKLRAGTRPSQVQQLLDEQVTVVTRGRPHIQLNGIDDDEVVVRITATPVDPEEGWLLADQVIAAIDGVTREPLTTEHAVVRSGETREMETVTA